MFNLAIRTKAAPNSWPPPLPSSPRAWVPGIRPWDTLYQDMPTGRYFLTTQHHHPNDLLPASSESENYEKFYLEDAVLAAGFTGDIGTSLTDLNGFSMFDNSQSAMPPDSELPFSFNDLSTPMPVISRRASLNDMLSLDPGMLQSHSYGPPSYSTLSGFSAQTSTLRTPAHGYDGAQLAPAPTAAQFEPFLENRMIAAWPSDLPSFGNTSLSGYNNEWEFFIQSSDTGELYNDVPFLDLHAESNGPPASPFVIPSTYDTTEHNPTQHGPAAASSLPVPSSSVAVPTFSQRRQNLPKLKTSGLVKSTATPMAKRTRSSGLGGDLKILESLLKDKTVPEQNIYAKPRDDANIIILRGREQGIAYGELIKLIKMNDGTNMAESTIRGRFRLLSVRPKDRQREVKWTNADTVLLDNGVKRQCGNDISFAMDHERDLNKLNIRWREVSDFIQPVNTDGAGSRRFDGSACKKKFMELYGIQPARQHPRKARR